MRPYVAGLSFSYGRHEVFSDFEFTPDSRVAAILGPSGAGKSTLLKILSGYLVPQACRSISPTGQACLVLQEDALLPWLTGFSNITTFVPVDRRRLENHPLFPFVETFLSRRAFEMSFGQRRMVELFRAILLAPGILLLDEPFNFLDPARRSAVVQALISDEMSATSVLLSTHHKDDLAGLSASVFHFDGSTPVGSLRQA